MRTEQKKGVLMIIIIRKLLGLCNHDWETYDIVRLIDYDGKGTAGYTHYVACKKCHKPKSYRVRGF